MDRVANVNVAQILDRLREDPDFRVNLTAWKVIPAREGTYAAFPEWLDERIRGALERRGIFRLYSHQREAIDTVRAGKNCCVVTPTASGKTLCYNLPVLQAVLERPAARALYLFPTKALGMDQVQELMETIEGLDARIGAYTFDGDTPSTARRAVREAGNIVVTNPDMLHTGILPHHTIWLRLFENLEYVVIDEIHHYRGVFGSHLANVIRRLKRICAFYGSRPRFICCSATIANPREITERLVEEPVELIDNNGAPSGEKHFLFYNPPVVNAELGIRASSVIKAAKIAAYFLSRDIQSIVFARSRLRVEILTTYLKEAVRKMGRDENLVRGYRGGYLPTERREIERGLREGRVMAVVSTNALELGIDIGSLDVCVMAGYSGSVASTWQQAGRAGRREKTALVVLVASSAPLDQYIIEHPDYFFGQSPESAVVDPNNLVILASHAKCAAFELPFREGETFGLDPTGTAELLDFLAENRILRKTGDKWHWSAEAYPASEISLRTAAPGNVVILDVSREGAVIGEVDYFSAPTEVYANAIYLHESRQYQVENLDLENRKAYARPVEVDYYTDAEMKVDLRVLDRLREEPIGRANRILGELSVTWLPTIYKKIRFGTHENVGWGHIHLPEQTMHTAAFWFEFPDTLDTLLETDRDALSGGLLALASALRQVAPVQVLCDLTDIRAHAVLRSPESERPAIFLYEKWPGGAGFSEKLFTHARFLVDAARERIEACPCRRGCPSCVGPVREVGERGKELALKLSGLLLG